MRQCDVYFQCLQKICADFQKTEVSVCLLICLTFYNSIPRNQRVAITGKTITRSPVPVPASEYLHVLAAAAAGFTSCKCDLLRRHYSLNSNVCNLILPSVSLMFSALEPVYPVYFQSNTSQSPPIHFFLSQFQSCTSSMASLVSTRPSSCNCLSASLAAVFLICPVTFFKFCTHNIDLFVRG